MMRRAVWIIALWAAMGAALASPHVASAQTTGELPGLDYDADSTSWNGLARLEALAEGMGLEVDAIETLDWSELGSGDILFVLYPVQRLEPSHVAAFIRNGGRVLLADDFGQSREALGRLSILREEPAGVDAPRYHAERSYAPVAAPRMSDHPLARGVDELVTNHPAVLRDVVGADVVFGFGEGEGVVAAGSLGRGRVVVVSDPSIFINRMMQFSGNLQFAVNLLRYLGRAGTSERLVILSGTFDLWGEPEGVLDDGSFGGKVDSAMADFNSWLDGKNEYLLTEGGLLALSVALALLLAAGAALSVPLRRKTALDGAWTRAAEGSRPQGDFEELVARYETGGDRPSFGLPAAILRDTLNAQLERVLETPEPIHNLSTQELCQRIAAARGPEAAEIADRLHPRLKNLPSRWQAASPWTVGYLSRREFERLHDDVQKLDRALQGD